MATTLEDAVPAEAADAPADETNPQDLVDIRVQDLIVGRVLRHPIYGDGGQLLLAAGMTLTSRFFDLLNQHNVSRLQVHREDAGRVTLAEAVLEPSAPLIKFGSDLTAKLDSIIDSGSLFVANAGPAVRESMVIHGCRVYDPEQRESLIQQHQATGESLDNMMREAMHGRKVDLSQIAGISAVYLTQLTTDCDSVLTTASEAGRDQDLSAHCLQMALLGMAIGVEMGLDERNVRNVGLCGLVHDWGMVKVPAAIRNARRVISSLEFLEIQKHPIYSLELLQRVAGIPTVVPLVAYQVHEATNGEGYPRGRNGNSIHLFARILKVADAYAALTSPKAYRPKVMPYAAMELLLRQAQRKHFDPQVVRALLHVVSLFPIGSLCTLNDGSVARVIRSNRTAYTTPVVQILQRADGEPVSVTDDGAIVDLSASEVRIAQALPEPGCLEVGLTAEIMTPMRA